MRIALVTETFPPEINGVAMTLDRVINGLLSRGHSIQVIRPRQHAGDGDSRTGDLEQLVVPGLPMPRYQGLRMGLPCRARLLKLWRGSPPDVVHVATEGPLGFSALRAAAALGVPISSSFHTNFTQYGRHYGYNLVRGGVTAYLRWFHNRAGCTMVPSNDTRDALARDGFRDTVVVSRGVDATLFNPGRRSEELRRAWGAGPDDPVAMYVGRIALEKNIPLTLRGFEALRQAEPRAKLVLVGDGPAAAGLRRDHPGAIFAGRQGVQSLAEHYASADLFLFASTTETFGNVVTEAMASGLVVLTYDYAAGRQHIRTGENGFLVPFDQPARFIAAAADLVRRRVDWPVIRSAAAATARTLSWGAIVGQFEDALLQVIHRGQPAIA
ncbi:MAG: glycosyltransferase family 1 protein [Planctomycetes bacterium]|nr:glycosyltransferase family 1 protein [Planctomycetota bacterium]